MEKARSNKILHKKVKTFIGQKNAALKRTLQVVARVGEIDGAEDDAETAGPYRHQVVPNTVVGLQGDHHRPRHHEKQPRTSCYHQGLKAEQMNALIDRQSEI